MGISLFSHGKIILLGEYAVLYGADALCLPLRTGQTLTVENISGNNIEWKWIYKTDVIADFIFHKDSLDVLQGEKSNGSQWIKSLITLIREQNPLFLKDQTLRLTFDNHFPVNWGLGTSSATISSICRLAKVDPFIVNQKLMGGSGADIACTTRSNWFLYRKKPDDQMCWDLPLDFKMSKYFYFIYSGEKMGTAKHLKKLSSKKQPNKDAMRSLHKLIYKFLTVSSVSATNEVIQDHERIISGINGLRPVGGLFSEFNGSVKSLGAWGGDFFLAVSEWDPERVFNYFHDKGYRDIFRWDDFVSKQYFH